VYVISVVAQLTGMHAQTLRQYDRLGLVTPQRTGGGGRRYSMRDVQRVREVQRLSAEGVTLTGIRRILELESHVAGLQRRVAELEADLAVAVAAAHRREAAGAPGSEVSLRRTTAMAVWEPRRWPFA
jgi:MerR family transcriptional regulator/heat shock protein HspR